MPLFDCNHGDPLFVKEGSSAHVRLEKLKERLISCSQDERSGIERSIRLQEAGLKGEEQVVFELKNSHVALCALQDLRLEHEGLSAQIDFLVIMPYVTVVIECKNLVGDITINERGDFIREFGEGRNRHEEGIYSPVTQNARHLDLMKAIRLAEKGTIGKLLQRTFFDDLNKSIVVLANPRTVLKDAAAPEEIRRQIVRGDGLIAHLKQLNRSGKEAGNGKRNAKEMRAYAKYWLGKHVPAKAVDASPVDRDAEPDVVPVCPKCGEPMVRRSVTKGDRKGKEMWGCSRFPRCRGVINID